MQIHDLNTKTLTNPAYVAFDDGTDTYKTEFNEVVENAAEAAVAEADLTENTVAFTSADTSSPTAWTNVTVLTSGLKVSVLFNRVSSMFRNIRYIHDYYQLKTGDSKDNTTTFTSGDETDTSQITAWSNVAKLDTGETHATLFGKISTMLKNIRYLYKMLGTTDISSIGNGTVTGALSTLNGKTGLYSQRINIAGNDSTSISTGNDKLVMLMWAVGNEARGIIIIRIRDTVYTKFLGDTTTAPTFTFSNNILTITNTASSYFRALLIYN